MLRLPAPTVAEIATRVIHNRISPTLDTAQRMEQAGFRSGFSTIDHIKVIHEAPPEQGVKPSYAKMLHNIYSTSTAFVNITEATKEFYVEKRSETRANGRSLNNLRFADDIVLLSRSLDELGQLLNELEIVCREVSFKINLSKTKFMQNKWVVKDKVATNNIDIETVEHCNYLGQLINMNGDSMPEIYRRITLGWRAYGRNSIVLKSNMPVYFKKKVFDECVLPVLTYACQTWTLNCQAKQKLRTAQRGIERAMLGFTRRDRKRTDYIQSVTKVRDILERVKTIKWQWAGHTARRSDDRWTTAVMDRIPRGLKRSRGRAPGLWDRAIRRVVGVNWKNIAQDRLAWKELKTTYVTLNFGSSASSGATQLLTQVCIRRRRSVVCRPSLCNTLKLETEAGVLSAALSNETQTSVVASPSEKLFYAEVMRRNETSSKLRPSAQFCAVLTQRNTFFDPLAIEWCNRILNVDDRFGASMPDCIPLFCYHRIFWIASHYGCKFKDVFTSKLYARGTGISVAHTKYKHIRSQSVRYGNASLLLTAANYSTVTVSGVAKTNRTMVSRNTEANTTDNVVKAVHDKERSRPAKCVVVYRARSEEVQWEVVCPGKEAFGSLHPRGPGVARPSASASSPSRPAHNCWATGSSLTKRSSNKPPRKKKSRFPSLFYGERNHVLGPVAPAFPDPRYNDTSSEPGSTRSNMADARFVKAVHDKVSTFEIDLRKKSSLLPAHILTGTLSNMLPVKLVTMDEKIDSVDKKIDSVTEVADRGSERMDSVEERYECKEERMAWQSFSSGVPLSPHREAEKYREGAQEWGSVSRSNTPLKMARRLGGNTLNIIEIKIDVKPFIWIELCRHSEKLIFVGETGPRHTAISARATAKGVCHTGIGLVATRRVIAGAIVRCVQTLSPEGFPEERYGKLYLRLAATHNMQDALARALEVESARREGLARTLTSSVGRGADERRQPQRTSVCAAYSVFLMSSFPRIPLDAMGRIPSCGQFCFSLGVPAVVGCGGCGVGIFCVCHEDLVTISNYRCLAVLSELLKQSDTCGMPLTKFRRSQIVILLEVGRTQRKLKAVRGKVSTFKINLEKTSLPLPAYMLAERHTPSKCKAVSTFGRSYGRESVQSSASRDVTLTRSEYALQMRCPNPNVDRPLTLHTAEEYTTCIQVDLEQGFQKCSFYREEPLAVLLGANQGDVSRVWKKYRETHSVTDAPRSGRPCATKAAHDRMVVVSVRRRPFPATSDLRRDLQRFQSVLDQYGWLAWLTGLVGWLVDLNGWDVRLVWSPSNGQSRRLALSFDTVTFFEIGRHCLLIQLDDIVNFSSQFGGNWYRQELLLIEVNLGCSQSLASLDVRYGWLVVLVCLPGRLAWFFSYDLLIMVILCNWLALMAAWFVDLDGR
ncbi:hypothetical protein PR048_029990 [Dryococelus australis]|uniref:Reverse transcriptase domain-containing protein n=1 Tax=Dryococelus australis TaxID=614101 RepID=A0ABQ9G7P6_9NEOP|nr:hypothetical protein PR048_029990 [Dryococelus australis]